ncbi:MAG: DUF72 domain-containing protein [Thermaerobacter sp.]|nr:DUF72 domain-containing protein [Thermaerobacter sp.]
MPILVGTCAWTDHDGFYPPGLPDAERLTFYASRFPLVEVDSTFYGLPRPATVENWIRRTPTGFVMDVKAERRMTGHDRGLKAAERIAACTEFAQRMQPLRDAGRMGPVLLQFPPWHVRSAPALAELRELCGALSGFGVSVEMRHRSWYDDAGAELLSELRSLGVAHVVADEPQAGKGSVPFVPEVTGRLSILRLHGRNAKAWYVRGESSRERFDYLYGHEEILVLAQAARRLAQAAEEVHVLFNNNARNYAAQNAADFARAIGQAPPPAEAHLLFPEG